MYQYSECRVPDRRAAADPVHPIIRELPEGLHLVACGCLDTEVAALELVGRHDFDVSYMFIFALGNGLLIIGF
jgi:hypothetical protein